MPNSRNLVLLIRRVQQAYSVVTVLDRKNSPHTTYIHLDQDPPLP